MFDREGIIDHIRELEEAVKDWERYQAISLKELRSDRDKRNMVLHALLVSMIAERGLRRPSTYRESFEILFEEGIIPPELGDALSDLAGSRNVLVHIYWRPDMEEVYGVLKNDLKTIKEFMKTVKKLLRET
jgi:uncharacterized protein YutE (UPF0331/DUF86 family)